MADYILTEQAGEDFDGIGLYSLDRWGLSKAESYLGDLDGCFGRLANDAFLGRDRSDIRPELLAYPCNGHMIFFRRDDRGDVVVLRVLSQSMDFQRHL